MLLNEDYESKIKKILLDPKFIALFANDNRHVYQGGSYTAAKFLQEIVNKFDPSYVPTAANADAAYIDYILLNLYSNKIGISDADEIRGALEVYMKQTRRNNADFNKNISSYRDIWDLVAKTKPYSDGNNFTERVTSTLIAVREALRAARVEKVYSNSVFEFYKVDSALQAKKVMANKSDHTFPEVAAWCAGYWCLAKMPEYFPAWVAIDVYGKMRYAIVPKSRQAFASPELKDSGNRASSMTDASPNDIAAIADFMLNEPGEIALTPFRRRDIGSASSYNMGVGDYAQMLLHSPTLEVANKLSNTQHNSAADFIIWFFNLPSSKAVSNSAGLLDKSTYDNRLSAVMYTIRRMLTRSQEKTGSISGLPLLADFKSLMDQPDGIFTPNGTPLDYKTYIGTFLPQTLAALKELISSPQNLLITSNAGNGYMQTLSRIYILLTDKLAAFLTTDKASVVEKLDQKLAALADEGYLFFENPTETVNVSALITASGTITGPVLTRSFPKFAAALKESFEFYMRTEALQSLKFDAFSGSIDILKKYIEGKPSEAVKNNLINQTKAPITSMMVNAKRDVVKSNNVISGMFAVYTLLGMTKEDAMIAIFTEMENYGIGNISTPNQRTLLVSFMGTASDVIRSCARRIAEVAPMTCIAFNVSTPSLSPFKAVISSVSSSSITPDTFTSTSDKQDIIRRFLGRDSTIMEDAPRIQFSRTKSMSVGTTLSRGGSKFLKIVVQTTPALKEFMTVLGSSVQIYGSPYVQSDVSKDNIAHVNVTYSMITYALKFKPAEVWMSRKFDDRDKNAIWSKVCASTVPALCVRDFLIVGKIEGGRVVCIDSKGRIWALDKENILSSLSIAELKELKEIPFEEGLVPARGFEYLIESLS